VVRLVGPVCRLPGDGDAAAILVGTIGRRSTDHPGGKIVAHDPNVVVTLFKSSEKRPKS
jgi:hypothetical protein